MSSPTLLQLYLESKLAGIRSSYLLPRLITNHVKGNNSSSYLTTVAFRLSKPLMSKLALSIVSKHLCRGCDGMMVSRAGEVMCHSIPNVETGNTRRARSIVDVARALTPSPIYFVLRSKRFAQNGSKKPVLSAPFGLVSHLKCCRFGRKNIHLVREWHL